MLLGELIHNGVAMVVGGAAIFLYGAVAISVVVIGLGNLS